MGWAMLAVRIRDTQEVWERRRLPKAEQTVGELENLYMAICLLSIGEAHRAIPEDPFLILVIVL